LIRKPLGRLVPAALFVVFGAAAQAGPVLQVTGPDGSRLAQMPFNGAEICLRWAHSVTGGAVADCFTAPDGNLTLTRSYLHDFAAGLGEVAGRGTLTSAPEGGYWIVGIDEAIPPPGLRLRIGPARVDHRLTGASGTINLSDLAANTRVTLWVVTD
jgi:hypothetical protein